MGYRLLTAAVALFLLCVGGQSAYATCTVPNTFVNNTTADADQVNANFTALLTCENTTVAIAGGGTNATSQTSGSYCYFDGTKITCDAGTAWTAYTPTITCAAGAATPTTLASNTGQYKRIGKTVHVRIQIGITTNGTCSGALIASLPTTTAESNASANVGVMVGAVALGAQLRGECCQAGTQNVYIYKYDGTYPGADGATIALQGVYEAL